MSDTPYPFECDNCGYKPTPQEVLQYNGDCAKCCDTVITFTVDAAEKIAELERFKAGALKLTTEASVEQVLK